MPFALAQDGEKGPKIEFDQNIHDFGDVDKGQKVTTKFKFKNTGDTPLEIKNVATSCGCTSAKPEKTMYNPGENGVIPVTFDSTRFQGQITKRVTITTNDTANPRTVVTIKGNVTVEINSKPSSLFFAKAKMGEVSQQELTISTAKLDKLEISNIRVQPEFLTAELVPVDDKTSKLMVKADGKKFPTGKNRLTGSVTYDTNSETQQTIKTIVTVNIERPIRATPNSIYFFASKAGKKRESFLKLISTEGKDFKLSDVKSDLEYVNVEVTEDKGTTKSLIVTLSDKAPEGKFQGTISINTSIQNQEAISIPIRGSVIK